MAVATSVGLAACGSSPRPPEVSPAPSARPVVRVVPAAPVLSAGPPPIQLPRSVSLDAFGEGERIADLAGLSVGDRTLLAWVTYFDDAAASLRSKKSSRTGSKAVPAAGAPGKQGATVAVRSLDQVGDGLAPPKVVSVKAVSSGGVALAQVPGSRSDIGLAWVGMDGGIGQVFITKLAETGEKQAQRMITHSKTGCSDVGMAATADGFVVAWVESKEPKTELFAAKVGKDLARVGSERRIFETKGEASDVRVIRRGEDDLFVVWNESRTDGNGGVAAARLLASDLTMRGDPAVVVTAPRHPRGLEVSSFGDGVEVAWVEEASPSDEAGSSGRALVLARLDASMRSLSGRADVPAAQDPTSVALDCDRVCRVVVPVAEHGDLAMYGFSYDNSQRPGTPRRLFSLSGVSTEDTSPVIIRDWLFFAEDNLHGGGRIRKAKIVW